MNQLNDPNVDKRLDAVRHFSELDEFSADLYARALGDDDWRVRKEAAAQFLQLPESAGRVDFLIDQLRHPDNAGLRNTAIEIIIGLGKVAIPELINQLSTDDSDVRKFLIDILGEIGDPYCAPELLAYLQDADENVRYAAVETLGKLKASEAAEYLVDLLASADTGLRFTIFEALASIGTGVPVERIIPYSEDRLLRKAVFSCLGSIGDVHGLNVLLAGLADPLVKTRDTALIAIGKIIKEMPWDEPLPPLVVDQSDFSSLLNGYLRHEEPVLRRAACYALCMKPDKDLLLKLLPLLAVEDLRTDVVTACRRIPEESLCALLGDFEVSEEITLCLIFLFGELGSRSIIPLATKELAAENPSMRYISAMTLGKVAAVDAVTQLGDLLADPVKEVRDAAAEALQALGEEVPDEVVRTLGPYLESNDPVLRLLSVRTLASLPTEMVEDFLLLAMKDVDPEIRCEALRSLNGDDSPRLLTCLSLALTDEESDVRRLAAEALSVFPPKRVLTILAHAVDDPDPWVRMAAIRAISGGSREDVEGIVMKGVADKVGLVVIAALESFSRLFPDDAEKYLLAALDNPDNEVVATAVRLLLADEREDELLTYELPRVRLAAIRELQRRPDKACSELFEKRLAIETDHEVRAALSEALRRGRAGV